MKAIASMIVCLALSACATTDYVSQLSEPGFGDRHMKLGEENVDPSLLMNGFYASKQMNGSYGSYSYSSTPLGYFCGTARCSQQVPYWAQGWAP
jgi:hypothetical protein